MADPLPNVPTPSRNARGSRPLSRAFLWAGLACVGMLMALGLHWTVLSVSHARQLADAESKAQLRAAQLSHAMALQLEMLVADVDFMARTLGAAWVRGGRTEAVEVGRTIAEMLPDGALVQASVADRGGWLRYGSLEKDGLPERAVSIADREHFLVHFGAGPPALYVSEPLIGRLSGQPSVLFSRPVMRDGRVDGVVYLAIAPDYLSGAFREVLPDRRDSALLVRDDGVYLARSYRFEDIVGQRAPATHDFMRDPTRQAGTTRATSVVDGVSRVYAFHRLTDYPLTVAVGLDGDNALAATQASIRASRVENAAASVLLLLATVLVGGLFVQRERAALELKESREQLELALAGGELGTWDWDVPSGRTVFSERWAAMLGYRLDELEQNVSTWEKLVHPDDWQVIHAALRPHLDGETAQYESEHRMLHRDGHWVWVLDRGRVVTRLADGSAGRVVGTHLDITARRMADLIASEASERLGRLVAEVPGVVYQYLLRPDGTSSFPYASPAIRSIYGLSAEEARVSAERVFERIHRGDLERVSNSIRLSAERLEPWRCEYRVCDASGAVRWLLGHANPQRLQDGSTLWHGYIQDVTEQHLAAEALQQSEERLRLTLDAVRDGAWVWEVATGRVSWDARCYEMLGYADGAIQISFDIWKDMLHPLDQRRLTVYLQRHFAEHSSELAMQELRVRNVDGKWVWVEARGRVVAWEDGLPARMVGTFTDISERVAERQLRDVLLERSSAVTFIASRDRRMISANARARQVFGQPGQDLAGIDLRQLHIDESHYLGMEPYYGTLFSRGQVRFEYPLRDTRGRTRWFDMNGVLRDPERQDSDVVWTLFDVTDRPVTVRC